MGGPGGSRPRTLPAVTRSLLTRAYRPVGRFVGRQGEGAKKCSVIQTRLSSEALSGDLQACLTVAEIAFRHGETKGYVDGAYAPAGAEAEPATFCGLDRTLRAVAAPSTLRDRSSARGVRKRRVLGRASARDLSPQSVSAPDR